MAKLSSKQKKAFENFLDEVDVNYWPEKLCKNMVDSGYYKTNFLKRDLESLQKAEDYLYAVVNKETQCSEKIEEIRYWTAIYFGEVFIEVYNAGEWAQCTEDLMQEYFGFPAIDKWCNGMSECFIEPFKVVDFSLEKLKKGGLVNTIVSAIRDRDEINPIDLLETEGDDDLKPENKNVSVIINGVLKVIRVKDVTLDKDTLNEIEKCFRAIKNKSK